MLVSNHLRGCNASPIYLCKIVSSTHPANGLAIQIIIRPFQGIEGTEPEKRSQYGKWHLYVTSEDQWTVVAGVAFDRTISWNTDYRYDAIDTIESANSAVVYS